MNVSSDYFIKLLSEYTLELGLDPLVYNALSCVVQSNGVSGEIEVWYLETARGLLQEALKNKDKIVKNTSARSVINSNREYNELFFEARNTLSMQRFIFLSLVKRTKTFSAKEYSDVVTCLINLIDGILRNK